MRLFVAAFVPDEAKDAVCSYVRSLGRLVGGVKWESREKLHVTLRFLGEVPESAVGDISTDIGERVCASDVLKTGFRDILLLPVPKNPRVVAVRLSDGARFRALFNGVEETLWRNGFGKMQRKFVPHITIGRGRGNLGGMDRIPGPGKKEFYISRVGLVRSELHSGGSRYTNIKTWDIQDDI